MEQNIPCTADLPEDRMRQRAEEGRTMRGDGGGPHPKKRGDWAAEENKKPARRKEKNGKERKPYGVRGERIEEASNPGPYSVGGASSSGSIATGAGLGEEGKAKKWVATDLRGDGRRTIGKTKQAAPSP